ncbi:MAG: hypothetical protein ACRDQU_13045 [Pseudonocardiaceae bacterium]
MLSTQIGGKYHLADDSVFKVKRVLTWLGVSVSHPLADEIKATNQNDAFAFDPRKHSFRDVEHHYYESIRLSDFHTVCNQFKADLGYLGASASLEMAYAMCYRRPIVVLHPVTINANVDSHVRLFIASRTHHLITHNFLRATSAENRHVLVSLHTKQVDYKISKHERGAIECRAQALLDQFSAETADVTA